MSYETSKVRLKLHLFPLKLQILCVVLVVATCYLLQLAPPKLNRSNAMTMTTAIRNSWNLVTLDTNLPHIYLGRVG